MKTKSRDRLYCGVDEEKILCAEPILNDKNMSHLLTFIVERYRVHLRKDIKHLPGPWTKDKVISQYRFTNIRREHDKQTQYLIKYISTNERLTLEEKILNTFLFRAWNNWSTMYSFGGPWTAEMIYDPALKECTREIYRRILKKDPERKWWSSAYNQGGTKQSWRYPHEIGKDKEFDIPLRVFHIGPWLKEGNIVGRLLDAVDQQEAFNVIKSVRGFADFLAYQVFVDLTYIKTFPFSENEFVVAGPGCKKGLEYVFDDFDGLNYEEALFYLRDRIDDYFINHLANTDYSGPIWCPEKLFRDLPRYDRKMNVMSLENCFCELSKYIRTIEGTGRPRVKYKISEER